MSQHFNLTGNDCIFSSRRKRLASAAKRASSLLPCNLDIRISATFGPQTSELEWTTSESTLKTMQFLVEDLEDFCKSKKLQPSLSKLVSTGKQFWNAPRPEVRRQGSLGEATMNFCVKLTKCTIYKMSNSRQFGPYKID